MRYALRVSQYRRTIHSLPIPSDDTTNVCTKHSATTTSDSYVFVPRACAGVSDGPQKGTAVGAWLSSRAESASSCEVYGVGTLRGLL